MLENGKMGCLRRVFEVIFGHNVINRHFLSGIRGGLFNVIRGLRPANLDCRIASGNDGHRWRLFSCCKLFNYPSPDTTVSTSPARGEVTRLLRSARNDIYCSGRSMIEMLGVLAIIGVLSVGGIAGYSKAMEKWKVNKAMEDYSDIIRGLLEYRENILKNNPDRQTGLTDVMQAAGLVPESWSKINSIGFHDPYGNDIYFYSIGTDKGKRISMDMYLGGETKNSDNVRVSANFSTNLCVELFNNLVYPLHSELRIVVLTSWTGSKSIVFYGDKFCAGKDKCLRSATLIDFKNACDMCDRANTYCNFAIQF